MAAERYCGWNPPSRMRHWETMGKQEVKALKTTSWAAVWTKMRKGTARWSANRGKSWRFPTYYLRRMKYGGTTPQDDFEIIRRFAQRRVSVSLPRITTHLFAFSTDVTFNLLTAAGRHPSSQGNARCKSPRYLLLHVAPEGTSTTKKSSRSFWYQKLRPGRPRRTNQDG